MTATATHWRHCSQCSATLPRFLPLSLAALAVALAAEGEKGTLNKTAEEEKERGSGFPGRYEMSKSHKKCWLYTACLFKTFFNGPCLQGKKGFRICGEAQ